MTRLKSSVTGLVSKPQGLRIAVIAGLFFPGLCAPVNGQENPSTNHTLPPSVGLEIGQQAPAFASGDVVRALISAEKTISITGELKYQAYDRAICYPPASVPLKWQLQIFPLDLKRSPKAIQHR